ncbi:MAG: HAMP domain-containing sensor histidine kinase [Candidatus Nitrosotenuis sp.]
MLFGKTSFKLSGTVGIIILLLGVTVLFGMYQMSKVSNEIIMISEEYKPLQNILGEIKFQHANQMKSFEKLQLAPLLDKTKLDSAKEEFWSSNVIMNSNIQQAKKLTQTGYKISPTDQDVNNFMLIHQMFSDIEQTQIELGESVREYLATMQENEFLLRQITEKQKELQAKIESTSLEIERFNEQSINAIEEHERGWLSIQIGIILIVGVIAVVLIHFFNQINNDLKKEIEEKTQELRDANIRLQELDKMKTEFISIASHELKSPIQPIFGFAELAQSGDIDQKEAWDGVTTLAKKLQDLATNILDVTRIENNRLALYPQKTSLNSLIRDNVAMLRAGIAKDVQIIEELGEDIEIELDRTRIEQVLRNLIGNAIKFTEKGTIRIKSSLNRKSGEVIVSVSDTGLGIPEDILPKIFGKFVTKGHERENLSGNGLGLFLCKGIINAHGGTITAKNNKDGGATFEFSLPLLPKKPVEVFTN